MADDVRKGLGIKRRKPNDGESSPAPSDSAPRRESSSSGPRLGIKRRSGPTATRPELDDEAEAAVATEEAPEGAADVAAPTEAPSGQGSGLGSDLTATLLAQHFKFRTELRARLPERLFQMKRTHGRYLGDGRESRTLELGFRPALVLYVLPPYGIDAPPKLTARGIVETGLHRQPTMNDTSFTVDGAFNKVGDMFVYVAFADDGKPLEFPGKTTQGRASRGGSSGASTSGPKLGIKRRK